MTTFSKHFAEKVSNLTCKELIHPDFDSCLSFMWYLQRTTIIRNLKFYAPILMIPLVVKYKNVSIKEYKHSVDTYLRMVVVTSAVGYVGMSMSCLLYNIFKEFRFYNIAALPSFIAISSLAQFFPPKYANLQILIINNLLIQTIFRNSDYKILQIVRQSKTLSTLSFMLISSSLMGLTALTHVKKHRFWYVRHPVTLKTVSTKEVERDEEAPWETPLKDLLYEELKNATKIGVVMSSIKTLSNCLHLLQFNKFKFLEYFICNFDYKLLGFLISYGISFQAINYLLDQNWNKTKQYRNLFAAGFLAGITFYLSPRFFIFTYGLTMTIDLTRQCILERADQHSKIVKFLQHVPWLKLVLILAISSYSHWKVTKPYLVPKFINTILQAASNERLDKMTKRYAKYILGI